MTMPAKEQRRINRKRAKIMRAIKEGYHLRVEIEAAIGIGSLSNTLGNMVKSGMLHTKPAPGHYDTHWNPVRTYWIGSDKVAPEPEIDDGMQALLDAWPIVKPQTDAEPLAYNLTDKRHNGSGLKCKPEISIISCLG